MTKKEIFEKQSEIRSKIDKLEATLIEVENSKPYLCFADRLPMSGEYYDLDRKNLRGAIPIIDLPEDLGLKELVLGRIKQEIESLESEFESLS